MKYLVFLVSVFLGVSAYSQHDFQVWVKAGTEGEIVKKLDWSFELNSRFGAEGVETFFPQAGLEYKVTKWFRPSLEYRYIFDKDDYGNYDLGHRINLNAGFKERVARFDLGLRLRYQYAFSRLGSETDYDADFDQAVRVKLSSTYDIDNSVISPLFNTEVFYNPSFGPEGPGLTKIRLAIGTSLELDGPHKLSFKYQIDKKLYNFAADLRHVIGFSYTYKL
jgi:hypothetical protein